MHRYVLAVSLTLIPATGLAEEDNGDDIPTWEQDGEVIEVGCDVGWEEIDGVCVIQGTDPEPGGDCIGGSVCPDPIPPTDPPGGDPPEDPDYPSNECKVTPQQSQEWAGLNCAEAYDWCKTEALAYTKSCYDAVSDWHQSICSDGGSGYWDRPDAPNDFAVPGSNVRAPLSLVAVFSTFADGGLWPSEAGIQSVLEDACLIDMSSGTPGVGENGFETPIGGMTDSQNPREPQQGWNYSDCLEEAGEMVSQCFEEFGADCPKACKEEWETRKTELEVSL